MIKKETRKETRKDTKEVNKKGYKEVNKIGSKEGDKIVLLFSIISFYIYFLKSEHNKKK